MLLFGVNTMLTLLRSVLVVTALLVFVETSHAQTVLFRDDFSTGTLNTTNWGVGNWTLGRTDLGNTPTVSGGIASLRLDTYNAGTTTRLRGSEIYTNASYARGANGIELETRVRMPGVPSGVVTSFFTHTFNANSTADEIDFEFLSKQNFGTTTNHKVQVTNWNDWDSNNPAYNNGTNHRSSMQTVTGLNLNDFNTFTIRWLPTRTDWLVNGSVIYSTSDALPDAAMPVRLNFWAPNADWTDAYDGTLVPVTTVGANQSYFYDVDYVEIRTAPVPEPTTILSIASFVLILFARWKFTKV